MTTPTGSAARARDVMRTACGRELTVSTLETTPENHQTDRVVLSASLNRGEEDRCRSGLTAEEARRLAGYLLAHADGLDQATQPGTMSVDFLEGERYAIGVRGHALLVDQPDGAGGADSAPTPTELFVASLASCVAFYAGRFLDRHHLDRSRLRVTAAFTMATDRPARVASVRLTVTAPSLPVERRPALHAVVSKCTVHNSLHQPPSMDIDIA